MVLVDDALLVGSAQAVREAKRDMQQMFDTKDMRAVRHFLGMTFTRHDDGGYSLTQPKYVEDMLARFHLTEAKPVATPLPMGRCQRMPEKRFHQIRPTKHLWVLCCTLVLTPAQTYPMLWVISVDSCPVQQVNTGRTRSMCYAI
jgi:hypothetical protein